MTGGGAALTPQAWAAAPGLAAAGPSLFMAAPHPAVSAAQGVALALPRLAGLLPEGALERLVPPAIAQAVGRRQLAWLGGRLCAEEALRRLGLASGVPRGPGGQPLWPAGVRGSITHTDTLACALAGPARGPGPGGLGIDTEEVDEAGVEAVLAVCCTPRERATLFGHGRPPREEMLTAMVVFSLKEAFYKAVHPRVERFVEFDELEVHALELEAGRARLRPCLPELPLDASFTGRFALGETAVHCLVDLDAR